MTATPESPDAAEKRPAPASPVRKIVLIVLGLLLAIYAYNVVADRITPYTSQATVDTFLVQIAPEVTGQVQYVGVSDNLPVKRGQLLFRIDRRPFEIALRSADANLASALQANQVSSVEVDVALARLRRQRVDLAASRELGRIVFDLVDQGALAQTNAIRARADIAKTEADVSRGTAEVEQARRQLGEIGYRNPAVQQALAAVEQARLDLSNTDVVAPADGVVTNLRLAPGQFLSKGQPVLSFIRGGPRWISADMRENQLGNVTPGDRVLIVLDHSPGRIFEGRVESIGWGVTQGGEAPTGQLPDVQPAAGWLRVPQRFPVRIRMIPADDGEALALGRSGAQANVIVLTSDKSILNPLGRLWMRLVSWFSYLR
ncbi:MAG: transporter [Phenylobacterium sp.]|uniref:HlyD family secretion protein n=1 Tax=Phenylobacterium sp. TaxID=1871053 RepID=UPI0025DA38EA|nr:HlyD family secretion protein [Phenylobacterium sp.]MBA4010422.1 transporter [Phenylobacterium sp.]